MRAVLKMKPATVGAIAIALMASLAQPADAQQGAQKKPQQQRPGKGKEQLVPAQLQQLIDIAQQLEKIASDPLLPLQDIAGHQLKHVASTLGPDRVFSYEFTPRPMGDNIIGDPDRPFPWQPLMGNCVYFSETLQNATASPCLESQRASHYSAPFFGRPDAGQLGYAGAHLKIRAQWARTIPAITLTKRLGTWQGQNAFGVGATVKGYDIKTFGLVVADPEQAQDLDLVYPEMRERAKFIRPDFQPLTREHVRRLKWRLQAQIDRFDGNYSVAVTKTDHHQATLDEPYEEKAHHVYLTARILKLEIFDPVSGAVVLRYPVQAQGQPVEPTAPMSQLRTTDPTVGSAALQFAAPVPVPAAGPSVAPK